jgi:hypothetical protein
MWIYKGLSLMLAKFNKLVTSRFKTSNLQEEFGSNQISKQIASDFYEQYLIHANC